MTLTDSPVPTMAGQSNTPMTVQVEQSFLKFLSPERSTLSELDIFKYANEKDNEERVLPVDQRARNLYTALLRKCGFLSKGKIGERESWDVTLSLNVFKLVVCDFPFQLPHTGDHDKVPGGDIKERKQSIKNVLDLAAQFVAPGGISHPGMRFFFPLPSFT